jgi:hypothetical protein
MLVRHQTGRRRGGWSAGIRGAIRRGTGDRRGMDGPSGNGWMSGPGLRGLGSMILSHGQLRTGTNLPSGSWLISTNQVLYCRMPG